MKVVQFFLGLKGTKSVFRMAINSLSAGRGWPKYLSVLAA